MDHLGVDQWAISIPFGIMNIRCMNQREREMEMERNDVTNHPGWRNSPGVGDEEAVAAPVGLSVVGSGTLIGRVGRWGVLWRLKASRPRCWFRQLMTTYNYHD
jgi:hypothetical protein